MKKTNSHERPSLRRRYRGFFYPERRLRCFLREDTLTPVALINSTSPAMENILIGLVSLALLAYLVTAVLRPEKF